MEEQRRIGVGFGIMILRDGKVLLGKRHDDPEKAKSLLNGAGKWTMPGGKLRFGESFEQGAKRELAEETGMSIGKTEVICINNDTIESAHFVTIGLLCKDASGEAKVMEPDEITSWGWFSLDKLPFPLYFPSEKLVANYKSKKFYIEN
jgi:8-oxo-dGTP diphosphatase